MGHSEDDAVHKITHKMENEILDIGLISNPL